MFYNTLLRSSKSAPVFVFGAGGNTRISRSVPGPYCFRWESFSRNAKAAAGARLVCGLYGSPSGRFTFGGPCRISFLTGRFDSNAFGFGLLLDGDAGG